MNIDSVKRVVPFAGEVNQNEGLLPSTGELNKMKGNGKIKPSFGNRIEKNKLDADEKMVDKCPLFT